MTVGITELPPEGMQLGGVALAGDADRGTRTTEGLSLLFTTAGITVQGPQPQIERLLVWSGLDSASCGEKVELPGGRRAAVMELTSGGQSIRFLLPTESVTPGQAAYLDQALPAWLERYKGEPRSPARTGTAAPEAAAQPAAPAAGKAAAQTQAAAAAASTTATPAAAAGTTAPPAAAAATAEPAAAASPSAADAPPPPAGAGPDRPGFRTGESAGAATHSSRPGPSAPDPWHARNVAPNASTSGLLPPPPPSPPPPPAPPSAAAPPLLPPPPASATRQAAPTSSEVQTTGTEPGAESGTDRETESALAGQGSGPLLAAAASTAAPARKARGWRRSRSGAEPSGVTGTMAPPAKPPRHPVPLESSTLPPPPAGPAVVWKPPVDPNTGELLWDATDPSKAGPEGVAPVAGGEKRRRLRRSTKAAAGGAAAGVAGSLSAGSLSAEALLQPPPPPASGAARAMGSGSSPDAAPPPADSAAAANAASTLPPPPASVGAPAGEPATPRPAAAPFGSTAPPEQRTTQRGLLVLLGVLLLVIVAAIGYVVAKRTGSSTPTQASTAPGTGRGAPGATVPTTSPDVALALAVNLQRGDLPAGWQPTAAAAVRPSVAPVAVQVRALQSLGTCLGANSTVVSGLFGTTGLPGQTASAQSATFTNPTADPGVQIGSLVSVFSSSSVVASAASPFSSPDFLSCYGQFQQAQAAGTVPGATATVRPVVLAAPAGVKTFAYVTTYTLPGRGTEVVGQAFILGGRMLARLNPSTAGPVIPYNVFTPAYGAVSGRVGASIGR